MEPTPSPDDNRASPGLARFWQVGPEPLPPAPARAAGRSGRSRHGDTDHSVPPDEETGPDQDVKSQEPFGGFGLGSRRGGAGRFLFGGRNAAEPETATGEPEPPAEASAPEPAPAEATEAGAADGADQPAGATPVEQAPPEADDQDAAATAGPSDENGREDMNGRAGSPSYAQTGEASGPDGTSVPAPPGRDSDETPEQARPVTGWAQVPTTMVPTTPGPVSGAPVSPGFAPNPYGVADFTPDHPAGTVTPVSGQPQQPAAGPEQAAPPAAEAPPQSPNVQIPATRTPPDMTAETGFSPTGYSLGRSGEAFGVAPVAPTSPPAPVTPAQSEFPAFPPMTVEVGVTGLAVGGAGRRAREESEEPKPAPRRSASLEDAEPVRRAGRRSAAREDEQPPAADPLGGAEEAPVTRTVWDEDAARHFRAAWHEVKAEFVDDPVTALTRAHDLLTDAVNELTEVLLAERDELDPLRGTDTPDTESMRMAMRGYREFLDRILSL